ncbi:MAG: hypothetical protein H6685_04285 [Deltaproteobacteria bacterium]|nr:hypothetical protein [Deltaproteobacteria bacterium]
MKLVWRGATLLLLAALIVGMGPGAASALEPVVRPWAQVFAYYSYNVSGYEKDDPRFDDNDFNQFRIRRTWLGLDVEFNEVYSARVVLDTRPSDVTRYETTSVPSGAVDDPTTPEDESTTQVVTAVQNDRSGRYEVWATYAYLRAMPFRYLGFDFGIVQSAYTSSIFRYWRHNYIMENVMFQYDLNRTQYGDQGLAMHGEFPGGFGGYRFAFLNGEGKHAQEANAGKALEGQLHLAPFQFQPALRGLEAMVYYQVDKQEPDHPELTNRVVEALLAYRLDIDDTMGFSINGEVIRREVESGDIDARQVIAGSDVNPVESLAYAVWADFWFARNYGVLARYDYLDPNTENDSDTGVGYEDEQTMLLAGVWVQPIKYVRASLNYRQFAYTGDLVATDGSTVDKTPDRFVFFNTEFKF